MKKRGKNEEIKKGHLQQRFVFKKFNRQLISIVGSTMLLLGNYAFVPIQVLANETTEIKGEETLSTESELPILSTNESLPTADPVEQPQEDITPSSETTETAEQILQSEKTEVTEEETLESTEESDKLSVRGRGLPQSPTANAGDWYAEEENGYMVIKGYSGDGVSITIPSEIENKPVAIDLKTVLGSHLEGYDVMTQTFAIEASGTSGPVKLTGSFAGLFANNSALASAAFADADTSAITNMAHMFRGCSNLISLDVSNWNTENVTNMGSMFTGCSNLSSLNVSSWNTEKVTRMDYMFAECSNLSSLDLSNWNTENVIEMYWMFANCGNLTSLEVSNWKTENATDMNYMFYNCSNLISLDVSNWNTENATINRMFENCNNLSELTCSKSFKMDSQQQLRSLPTPENDGKTTYHWVRDNREEVYPSTADLISGHNSLSDANVHTYTIQKKHAVSFDADGGSDQPAATTVWDQEVLAVPDYKGTKRDHNFIGWNLNGQPYDFTQQVTEPLELKANWEQSEWITEDAGTYTRIIGYTGTGENIKVPSTLYDKPVEIDLGAVLGSKLSKTKTFAIEASGTSGPVKLTGSFERLFMINYGLTSATFADADTSAITNMAYMFQDCRNLISLDVSNWNTENVTNMSDMFYDCRNLNSLDVSNWNTENVTSMSSMFCGCEKLISLDISNWNTENVTRMNAMFYNCSNLNSLDISNWNTENVTSMSSMFAGCSNLNSLDISNWDTEKVDHMYNMFDGCGKLISLDISNWNTENVKNMEFMFDGCSNLISLDLSSWNTENVIWMNWMFANCGNLTSLDISSWKTENAAINKMFENCNNLSELTCSKSFKMDSQQDLRSLPTSENDGKTTYHWVMDDEENVFDSTTDLISGHNGLSDTKAHTYTIQKKHKVAFDVTGGSTELTAQRIFENRKVADPNYNGTKANHQFTGWTLEGEAFDFDQTKITAPIQLVATWRLNQYSIGFNKNGGTGTMQDQELKYDEEKPLSANAFSKTGYTFTGWNSQADGHGEKSYTDQQTVKNLSATDGETITLYAQWQANSYQIHFDSNGGEGTQAPQGMTYDQDAKLTEHIFTKKGYKFSGWNTQKDGKGQAYADKETVKNLTDENNGQVTLFAQWTAETYTITFDSKGGEAVPNKEYTVETETFLLPEANRKGYTFLGWYDDETKVESIEKGTTGNKQLVAKWEAIEYKVTFDSAGGSEVPAQSYTVEKGIDAFTTPTRTGYAFQGWYDGETKVESIKKGSIGNKNLIAKWKTIAYEVTFDSAGGSTILAQSYTIEKGIDSFDTPTRKGYTFQGWYDGETKVESIEKGTTGNKQLLAKWEVIEYQVSFDSAGGSEVPVQNYTVEKGIDTFTTPTRTGYTFLGWYDGETKVESIKAGETGNRALTAKWTMDTYTITFDSNGGEAVEDKKYTVETDTFSLPELTREGYTFQGWYDGETKVESIEKGTTGNKQLLAKWEVIEYQVSFDSAGGSEVPAQNYTIEKGIDSFDTPTRTGYTFQGWYDGETKVESIEKGTTGNKQLAAKWEVIEYQVNFDSAGGSEVPAQSYTVEQGIDTFTTPSRTGYTFQGWYDGETKVESIQAGETGNRTLTAKWTMDTYTITFDSNGGEAVPNKEYTVETATFKLPELTREGYIFQGWYDGETKIKSIEKGTTGNKQLLAKWEVIEYQVTFDSAGGSAIPVQSYTVEQGIDTFTTPSRTGYTFQGWYDGETKVESIQAGETGNRTLTAKWTMDTYTITFDSNGGEAVSPIEYNVETKTFSLPNLERESYIFLGWYDGETKVETIEKGMTGNRALIAKWTAVEYTVTFDSAGGSALPAETYTIEKGIDEFTTPTKTGYTFLGWFNEDKEKITSIKAGATGNCTLTAQWQANQYTVTFDSNGGAGELPPQQLIYDEAAKLSENTFTRDGYTFVGWNTQADGKGTTYTDSQEVKNLIAEPNGAITLFAQWKTKKTALEDLVNKEQETQRDKNKYTEDSWKNYEAALEKAKKVLADEKATPQQIDTAFTELKTAIANLKPIEKPSGTTTGTSSKPTSTHKTYPTTYTAAKNYPRTGMIADPGLVIVGLATVGVALAGWWKRKEK
ncbi:hypothetical protein NRIC_06220 [Enterococcus florum]|uniref:Gram-positive cocci surface proteins LPxTG domain-containing protein n=1 Tax=Enterococcus florum TaxID=2480627 RepID=A0A4P5P935_9ENTE|nr:InlB B-repeat-containing protein [Enterococcus florum]GCF92731.1 hypothetical protein NRIC_06220 [Enterococcus florum]